MKITKDLWNNSFYLKLINKTHNSNSFKMFREEYIKIEKLQKKYPEKIIKRLLEKEKNKLFEKLDRNMAYRIFSE